VFPQDVLCQLGGDFLVLDQQNVHSQKIKNSQTLKSPRPSRRASGRRRPLARMTITENHLGLGISGSAVFLKQGFSARHYLVIVSWRQRRAKKGKAAKP
jgi:hypothetical protein